MLREPLFIHTRLGKSHAIVLSFLMTSHIEQDEKITHWKVTYSLLLCESGRQKIVKSGEI